MTTPNAPHPLQVLLLVAVAVTALVTICRMMANWIERRGRSRYGD